jgi:hypothetical protein
MPITNVSVEASSLLDMAPDQLINIYGLSGEFASSVFGTKVIIPLDCLILENGNGRLL